jgi:glycosyltransferase involved in cell wall biosynthesis
MAVAPPRFEKAPTVADLPTAIVPPSQRRGFVAVARLVENKGMDDLVRAYALAKIRHADAPLTIIGDGPLKMMIAEVAVKSGVAAHVAMPGFVDARARDAAIRSARWLVAPAKTHEDLGLTPIEARHVGVPCIVTRDGGLPEAAGKESLLCDPGDVAGLTHCIEAAANCNEDEYVTRSERTRAELLAYLRPLSWFSDRYRVMAADHRRGRRKSGPLGH